MHACTFCECADMAVEKSRHDTAPIGFYDMPPLVNSAFACEVFLKTILKWFDIQPPKSHKLKDLYEKLPEEFRKQFEDALLKSYGGTWMGECGVDYLSTLSNAFQEFRYFYEHDFRKSGSHYYIETTFLQVFRDALRDCCCRVIFNIGWEQYKVLKPIGSKK